LLAVPVNFAAEAQQSGISSLGINLKGFVFQLLTFLIVLLILRKYVFPKIVDTLEARRKTLEESLAQAKQTEETLAKAEAKSEEILAKARAQADEALAEGKKAAEEVIAKAEDAGAQRAAQIVADAESHLDLERDKLRRELKAELGDLVADATEQILQEKLNDSTDRKLIQKIVGAIK
jgi:F-type H+-transporting ATPase subunit b